MQKAAKIFLLGMYIHLFLSIAVPIGILYFCIEEGWNIQGVLLLLFYIAEVMVLQALGWVFVGFGTAAYKKNDIVQLRQALKICKLQAAPFRIIHAVYTSFAWFSLVGASRGILIFLVPIPIFVTCSMIVQSGCIGIFYLKCIQKIQKNNQKESTIFYRFYLLPIL